MYKNRISNAAIKPSIDIYCLSYITKEAKGGTNDQDKLRNNVAHHVTE